MGKHRKPVVVVTCACGYTQKGETLEVHGHILIVTIKCPYCKEETTKQVEYKPRG